MKWAIFLLFLPNLVLAQNLTSDEKSFDYPEFRECGLVTRFSPSKIPPNCLTKALNVYYDDDFTTSRRSGYSQFNSTACGNGIVSGMWNFDAISGLKYIALQVGASFYYTTSQGGCTQITGLNLISLTYPLECTQMLGRLYCVNGVDYGFSWTGSTISYHYTMPLGTLIGGFRNRVVLGNVSGDPSRLYLSGEGDGDDWHVEIPGASTSPASIAISGLADGKGIVGLMGQYQNTFMVGRQDDIYSLSGNDRRDFTLRQISSQIGIKDKRTVREKDNCLIWLSNRGVEKQCGSSINRTSDGIKNNIDEIILSVGNTRQKNYNTQGEWEAGTTQVGGYGATSTSIDPGSVVPSTWGASIKWNDGQLLGISSSIADNYIFLRYSSSTALWDDFSSDSYSPKWSTVTFINPSGSYLSASSEGMRHRTVGAGYTEVVVISTLTNPMPFGTWMIRADTTNNYYSSIKPASLNYYFISDGNTVSSLNGYKVSLYSPSSRVYRAKLVKTTAGKDVVLADSLCNHKNYTDSLVDVVRTSMTITRDSNFNISVSFYSSVIYESCGSLYATDISTFQNIYAVFHSTISAGAIPYSGVASASRIDDIYYSSGGYVGGGQYFGIFTSTPMDTTFSTPTAGYFEGNDYVDGTSTVAYQLRYSSNSVDWTEWVTIGTDSYHIFAEQRYWQYRIRLETDISTTTPIVLLPTVKASVTGYYMTECIDTSGGTSVGTFRPVTNITGGNNISFFASSGTNCNQVTRATATWVSQTVNAPLVIGTAAYTGVQAILTPYASTDNIKLDGLTIEWYEGDRAPLGSAVYKDRYYLFYTTSTAKGAENNNALVYDLNGVWTMLDDVYAYSSVVHNTKLYTGDSRGNGIINQQDIGLFDIQNDNSGNLGKSRKFDFTIKTNDYDFGNPVEKKQLRRVYLMLKSGSNSDVDVNITLKYYINGSTTAHTFTPQSNVYLSESDEPGLFVAKFPAPVDNEITFNWLSFELTYNGDQGPLSLVGIKTIYKPLRWE